MKILIERNQLLLKKLGLALFDMFAVVVSSLLALVLRFEGNYSAIPREYIDRSLQYISIVMVVTLIIFYVLRLYGSLWSYAGATEFMNIIIASILSSGVQMAVIVLMDMKMPRSYYVFYGMCLFGMVAVSRYSYRVLRTVAKRHTLGREIWRGKLKKVENLAMSISVWSVLWTTPRRNRGAICMA